MRRANSRARQPLGATHVAALALAVTAVGCSSRFEVEQSLRRPDAAVETFPPAPVCRHEPHEVGVVVASAEGRPAAGLVRWRDRALLVRLEPTAAEEPTRLVIASVETSGALRQEGETTETGAPGAVAGFSVIVAGGGVRAAITREDGRVDLLGLSIDGASEHPPRALSLAAEGPARLLWHRGAPLVEVDGAVHVPDADGAGEGGEAGDGGPTDGGVDDGGAAATAPPAAPGGLRTVIVAGEGLGWVHGDDSGLWLSHRGTGRAPVRTVRVDQDGEAPVHLLWAGDRYLVADGALSRITRYVVPEGRRGGGEATLGLGGRFVVPRPPGEISLAAWDNSGPRHVGVAQALGPRHLRFLNLALAGQVLDAETHIRTERDIAGLEVLWDGLGYVVAWSERDGDAGARMSVTRFSCPDDE